MAIVRVYMYVDDMHIEERKLSHNVASYSLSVCQMVTGHSDIVATVEQEWEQEEEEEKNIMQASSFVLPSSTVLYPLINSVIITQ